MASAVRQPPMPHQPLPLGHPRYVASDVAADALTVTYGRREPEAERGRTQTTAYLVRTVGQICAQLLVGLGMNGPECAAASRGGVSE